MPDFERVMRSLELHVASVGEQRAFVRGKHAGEDKARWQLLALFAVVNLFALTSALFIAHANL